MEEYYYFYFIENHLEDQNVKLKLKGIYNELELVKTIEKKDDKENNFVISVYRFKIDYSYPTLELTDKKSNKFEFSLYISSKKRDNFKFDLKFDNLKKTFGKDIKPPKSLELTHREQFDIYFDILINYYIDNPQINLVKSFLDLLYDYDGELEFSIYLSILKEAISFSLTKDFLDNFNLNKVKNIGTLTEQKIIEISEILYIIEITYDDIIKDISNSEKKEDNIVELFSIILYFNFNYNRKRISELINNENINQYFYKGLLKYYKIFLLILEKEHISNLINISKNFNELKAALSYCKNVYSLIEIVLENFSKFNELHKDSYEKIEIASICRPKKDDNLKKIFESYLTLYSLQKDNDEKFFIVFDSSLINKYINIGLKYDDLISFKEMLKATNKTNDDIDKLFHKNGLVLIINGKLKNMEIINFFQLNHFYNSDDYSSRKYHSLLILNGLDINVFDDQFYLEWRKIKWKIIFKKKYEEFIDKVVELVDNMKHFHILFKLLNESENNYKFEFDKDALYGMLNHFIYLMKYNIPKDFSIYINDLVLLIVYSDKKIPMNSFLSKLRGMFDVEIILQIYTNIILNYKNIISKETNDFIINYFTTYFNKISPTNALNFIIYYPLLSERIFNIINKFTIQKKDIFQIEESENLTLFKGLINEKYLEKEEYKNNEYFINSLSLLNQIKNSIEINEITYNDIYLFYNKNEQRNEPLLLSRLKLIFLNEEGVEHYMDIIDKNYNEINNILNDLELILNNFKKYYANKESENIKLLEELINNIKNSKFNNYKNNYSDKYSKFISNYKNKAKEIALKEKSLFFKIIFNNKNLLYEDDNESCINETIKSFDSLKYIFIKEDINLVDKKILKVCLNEIKDMKKEDINKEIGILENIFEEEINNIDYDVEEITDIFIYTINNLILNDKLKDSFNKNIDIKDKIKEDSIRVSDSKKTKIKKNKNIIFKKIKLDDIIIKAEKTKLDRDKNIIFKKIKLDDINIKAEKTKLDRDKNILFKKIKLDDIIIKAEKTKLDDSKSMGTSFEKNDLISDIEEKNKKIFELEKLNKELMEKINKLKKDLNIEKSQNKDFDEKINRLNDEINREKIQNKKLDEKIKELNTLLEKEKANNIQMGKMENRGKDNEKVVELMEKIMEKDKELNEIKSRRPIELKEGEKLMTIIFTSPDQKFLYSLICKNTDKFSQLEQKLYEKYNEFMESDYYFKYNGKKIIRFKSVEKNGIENSGIIIMHKKEE